MKTVCGITFDENKILSGLSTEAKTKLKKYLNEKETQELIEDNRWEEVIEEWIDSYQLVGDVLISFLLYADVPFLDHIANLKSSYFGNNALSKIDLPNSIVFIEGLSIQDTLGSIKEITLPNSITEIEHHAFFMNETPLTSLNYKGTKKEWKKIKKARDWFFDYMRAINPIKIIHCTDGDLRL